MGLTQSWGFWVLGFGFWVFGFLGCVFFSHIPSLLPIPTVERIYFHFGEAIDTREEKCDLSDAAQVRGEGGGR